MASMDGSTSHVRRESPSTRTSFDVFQILEGDNGGWIERSFVGAPPPVDRAPDGGASGLAMRDLVPTGAASSDGGGGAE